MLLRFYNTEHSGVVKTCWAYKPEILKSKLRFANIIFLMKNYGGEERLKLDLSTSGVETRILFFNIASDGSLLLYFILFGLTYMTFEKEIRLLYS